MYGSDEDLAKKTVVLCSTAVTLQVTWGLSGSLKLTDHLMFRRPHRLRDSLKAIQQTPTDLI